MKRIIGIATVNRHNLVGSVYVGLAVFKPDFKRKHPRIKDFFNPQWLTLAKNELIQYECARLTPNQMEYDISEWLRLQHGEILNRVPRFWKNTEIYNDIDHETNINVGVKKQEGITHEIIKYNPKAYAVRVARQIAQMYLFQESVQIKEIYGDFGKGTEHDEQTQQFIKENPSCIWIR